VRRRARLTALPGAASVRFHELLVEDRIVPAYHDVFITLSPCTLRVPMAAVPGPLVRACQWPARRG
jgi:hypothetical protein